MQISRGIYTELTRYLSSLLRFANKSLTSELSAHSEVVAFILVEVGSISLIYINKFKCCQPDTAGKIYQKANAMAVI